MVLVTLASQQATSQTLDVDFIAQKHEQWIVQHGRTYLDSAEKERRFQIFKKNYDYIEKCPPTPDCQTLLHHTTPTITRQKLQTSLTGGLAAESNYPYQGEDGICDQQKATDKTGQITGFQDVTPNDEQALQIAVSQQPVSVGVAASGDFQHYEGGIFKGYCGDSLNHAVTIVGYGNENGMDYWLIKNSWGQTWGEDGYMKILRGSSNSEGQCKIATIPSFPTAQ
ncbi:hypothetical protein Dsin_021003 [Dipteronia sinensis]|uniref:Peptidase C1A papain C-terminal domain-containing protein n=1 Tax=Dipteronia sinensis TaxID=43782 RepID=A0AAE0AAB7_9ROSI|nr:hypothetical protein Dsin_021003 [Dipteronia sinensis]